MARRHLLDASCEARQDGFEIALLELHRARREHLAVTVAGSRRDPETQRRQVGLVRVEQRLRELGGLAEANGQQPARQRIERARMPGLLRAIKPLRALQSGVGRKPYRLVEQKHAVDSPAPADVT